jgi:hypothetical protein
MNYTNEQLERWKNKNKAKQAKRLVLDDAKSISKSKKAYWKLVDDVKALRTWIKQLESGDIPEDKWRWLERMDADFRENRDCRELDICNYELDIEVQKEWLEQLKDIKENVGASIRCSQRLKERKLSRFR